MMKRTTIRNDLRDQMNEILYEGRVPSKVFEILENPSEEVKVNPKAEISNPGGIYFQFWGLPKEMEEGSRISEDLPQATYYQKSTTVENLVERLKEIEQDIVPEYDYFFVEFVNEDDFGEIKHYNIYYSIL